MWIEAERWVLVPHALSQCDHGPVTASSVRVLSAAVVVLSRTSTVWMFCAAVVVRTAFNDRLPCRGFFFFFFEPSNVSAV